MLLLRGQTNRAARYVCAIAMAIPGQETIICQDTMEGEIALKPEGKNGFGYDPIFFFPPANKTAAMMDLAEKNQYSHRAKATRQLLAKVKDLMKMPNHIVLVHPAIPQNTVISCAAVLQARQRCI